MTNLFRTFAAGAVVLGMGTTSLAESPSGNRIRVPAVPPELEVPTGYSVFLKGQAAGTQNYICLPSSTGTTWKFFAPQATLFQKFRGDLYQQIATHFLAPSPKEPGTLRPAWLHSFDSSQVWGRMIASSTDASFVEPGAIPWLLLEMAGAEPGPSGGGILAQTAYIQRLNTSGGAAPAGPCTQIGTIVMVPYTTDYYFYRSNRRH